MGQLVFNQFKSREEMKELKGKTAFVTGAAAGIGLGIARALARASVNVALADVQKGPLQKGTQEINGMGVKAYAFLVDLADRVRMYEIADRVEEAFGDIHILVNNAGRPTLPVSWILPSDKCMPLPS